MKSLIQKGIYIGLGLAMMSKEQVEKIVEELVEKGEVPVTESKNLVSDIINKGEKQQQVLEAKLREKVKEMLVELNIASKDDIAQLEERIKNLETRE
ncbi:MAG: polyhydroxyalkanoate synthesis regulator [Elusimicrobiota bacterium]|uniref:Polyhydroxyalkanoate synthesis regulator phasin n=1 Tax=Desulforamulus putei DSM 12395 TaxID=1121429 RepID=A0A1M5CWP3_9FIRM|nr:polyhydroxyalkanoate synthesis regulator [Desulforamulus putei]SHF59124.1 Polyhydroxyalkanoate synthesis regulator phasin [Desulforamulus putei DSM 12395]